MDVDFTCKGKAGAVVFVSQARFLKGRLARLIQDKNFVQVSVFTFVFIAQSNIFCVNIATSQSKGTAVICQLLSYMFFEKIKNSA